MPTFPTTGPIQVNLSIHAGDVTITASQRDDVSVELVPRDPGNVNDVKSADNARVEFRDGRLLVKTSRPGLGWSRLGAVRVTIALPEGSRLAGHTEAGDLRTEGVLGDTDLKTGAGTIDLATTGTLKVISGAGDISVGAAAGNVLAVTGSGALRVGRADGDVIVKNGNGATTIGTVAGVVRIAAANGDVTIEHAERSVTAKTANGSIRVGSVASGDVDLKTAFGTVEIGIAHGTAARLDVKTTFGLLRQELDPTGAPPSSQRTASVKARTSHGDITIRRAEPEAAAA